jgi:hypothetical protein
MEEPLEEMNPCLVCQSSDCDGEAYCQEYQNYLALHVTLGDPEEDVLNRYMHMQNIRKNHTAQG